MSSKSVTVVGVGSVRRRQSADVVKEMAEIAKGDIARMVADAAPTPTPTPGPGRYSQRRPIKYRRPINPAPPEPLQVAAVKTSWENDARERYLLEEAEKAARRPRTPTPPRQPDDYYDLARWSVVRWR